MSNFDLRMKRGGKQRQHRIALLCGLAFIILPSSFLLGSGPLRGHPLYPFGSFQDKLRPLYHDPGTVAIPHVADANARLSLLGISVGHQVIQDDNMTTYQYNGDAEAVQIIGAGTLAANGYYTKRGTHDGKPYYNLIGAASDAAGNSRINWSTGPNTWAIFGPFGDELYTSTDAVAYPWLVTTWVSGHPSYDPVPTTAQIASKNALLTCTFVSGAGTAAANGIYTERPALGLVEGQSVYNLLGQPDDFANYAIYLDTRWKLTDGGGATLYRESATGASDPWTVGAWIVQTGDSPAPTVASVSQGSLDSGVLITGAATSAANDIYLVVSPIEGRNAYYSISGRTLDWSGSHWQWQDGSPQSSDDTAVPFEAGSWSDSAVVTADPIASEANWEPLP